MAQRQLRCPGKYSLVRHLFENLVVRLTMWTKVPTQHMAVLTFETSDGGVDGDGAKAWFAIPGCRWTPTSVPNCLEVKLKGSDVRVKVPLSNITTDIRGIGFAPKYHWRGPDPTRSPPPPPPPPPPKKKAKSDARKNDRAKRKPMGKKPAAGAAKSGIEKPTVAKSAAASASASASGSASASVLVDKSPARRYTRLSTAVQGIGVNDSTAKFESESIHANAHLYDATTTELDEDPSSKRRSSRHPSRRSSRHSAQQQL